MREHTSVFDRIFTGKGPRFFTAEPPPNRHRITPQKIGVRIGRRGSIHSYVTEPDKAGAFSSMPKAESGLIETKSLRHRISEDKTTDADKIPSAQACGIRRLGAAGKGREHTTVCDLTEPDGAPALLTAEPPPKNGQIETKFIRQRIGEEKIGVPRKR